MVYGKAKIDIPRKIYEFTCPKCLAHNNHIHYKAKIEEEGDIFEIGLLFPFRNPDPEHADYDFNPVERNWLTVKFFCPACKKAIAPKILRKQIIVEL